MLPSADFESAASSIPPLRQVWWQFKVRKGILGSPASLVNGRLVGSMGYSVGQTLDHARKQIGWPKCYESSQVELFFEPRDTLRGTRYTPGGLDKMHNFLYYFFA